MKDIDKDLQQVVLSVTQDKFFEQHMHANFGDLGMAVKSMLDEYQKQTKSNENIQSIEDMQRFLENYPAFRSHSLNVSKHVALMGELAAKVRAAAPRAITHNDTTAHAGLDAPHAPQQAPNTPQTQPQTQT